MVVVGRRDQVRGQRRQADRGDHRRDRQQHRHAGRDQRAERDDQDHQRHRQAEELGLLEVLAERLVEGLADRRAADLLDPQRPGAACWTAAVAARSGSTRSAAVSGSPLMVTGTQQRGAVGAGIGSPTLATSGTAAQLRGRVGGGRAGRGRWSSGPQREVMSTFSTAGSSSKLPSSIIDVGAAGLADAWSCVGRLVECRPRCRRRSRPPRTPPTARSRATDVRRSTAPPAPSPVACPSLVPLHRFLCRT